MAVVKVSKYIAIIGFEKHQSNQKFSVLGHFRGWWCLFVDFFSFTVVWSGRNLTQNFVFLLQDVSSNKLGARGCQWMCDMLQNNVNLLKIDLANNGFTDKDTVYLLEAFKVV